MDIFGHERAHYELIRDLDQTQGAYEAYELEKRSLYPYALPNHNFQALEQAVDQKYMRATVDAAAIGYLTDNLLSLQTVPDEILYTDYRLPSYVEINTTVPEGARTYGIRVVNRRGKAARISGPGYDAPSATAGQSIVTQEIDNYGLDAEWSISELRGAMFGGFPLDTQSMEAATTGTMETMEEVALLGYSVDGNLGSGLIDRGLLTQETPSVSGATPTGDQVWWKEQGENENIENLSPVQTRTLITKEISAVIEQSKETVGRQINSGMTVYLPGPQYDSLSSNYIGDNAEKSIMQSLIEDNPWTHFTKGNPLMIERVLELSGETLTKALGTTTKDRMVVALKNNRIAELGVPIMPRILRIADKGRVMCAMVEAEFSTIFVKRPNTIRYVDGI